MDKLKFVAVLLFFVGLLVGFCWAGYEAFGYLGFQKSALLVLIIEGFFTARGAYLVAVAWDLYRQEIKELRSDLLRLPALLGSVRYDAAPLTVKQPAVWPRFFAARILALVILALSLGGTFLVFGSISSILLAVVISQGLLVRYLYKFRQKIIGAQNELEEFRLTFAKNEKNRSLDV